MLLTAAVVGLYLIFWCVVLLKKGLWGLRFSGFWAWVAFLLYFVVNPAFSVYSSTFERYDTRLSLSGRGERALWILAVVLVGITFYYVSYLGTRVGAYKWRLSNNVEKDSGRYLFAFLPFVLFGFYSLLFFRSGLLSSSREIVYSSGRFVGSVIGYEDAGYLFLFVPIVFLLLHPSSFSRLLGSVLFGLFMLMTIPSGWARYAIVSIVAALLIVNDLRQVKKITQLLVIVFGITLAAVLQIRGHVFWQIGSFSENVSAISDEIADGAINVLGSDDISMLSTFYVESFFTEKTSGYDYGVTTLNYLLTGWIPGRLFPQKYFLVDRLSATKFVNSEAQYVGTVLYGGKSTLFGSFYTSGWLFGVMIGSILTGYLTRKIDGMLFPESPLLLKTLAVCWLSVLWIVWGSSQTWGVVRFGVFAIPAMFTWFILPKKAKPVRIANPYLHR